MRGTPTKPLSYRAAELAFILDEIGSVSFAYLFTATFGHCRAGSTYELFPLEVDGSLVGSLAVLHATEVGVLALEAHVVRQPFHGISLQVLKVWILWVTLSFLESVLFVQVFKFCSLLSFFEDNFFKSFLFLNELVQRRALLCVHSLLAFGAVEIAKLDSGAVVAGFYEFLDAVVVENVTAT